MADRDITFGVPAELFGAAASRLCACGVEDPDELVEIALRASAIDALETMGGSGPVPTALSDVRAARLLEVCKIRKQILDDEVVGVLFRVMPSTAGAITRRMQATYESALDASLTAHMLAEAKLTCPEKAKDADPKHKIVFATSAAYGHAVKKIRAEGLLREVTRDSAKRSLEFDQEVEVPDGDKKKKKVKFAETILGIS